MGTPCPRDQRPPQSRRPHLQRLDRDRPGGPRLQGLSEGRGPRELVLDASVAVKFYLSEERREEALDLLSAVAENRASLLASGTVQPELFNALWQQYRRGSLFVEEVREYRSDLSVTSMDLYRPKI